MNFFSSTVRYYKCAVYRFSEARRFFLLHGEVLQMCSLSFFRSEINFFSSTVRYYKCAVYRFSRARWIFFSSTVRYYRCAVYRFSEARWIFSPPRWGITNVQSIVFQGRDDSFLLHGEVLQMCSLSFFRGGINFFFSTVRYYKCAVYRFPGYKWINSAPRCDPCLLYTSDAADD